MNNLEFISIRKYFTETYTISKLLVDQTYLCDILEDKVRDLRDLDGDGRFDSPGEGKVYGKTAIPAGRYRIIMRWSPRWKQMVPTLLDVPGFTAIQIHPGNTPEDTHGCLVPGENKIKGKVINSRYRTTVITQMIKYAIAEKRKVYITIKE